MLLSRSSVSSFNWAILRTSCSIVCCMDLDFFPDCLLCLCQLISFSNFFFQGLLLIFSKFEDSLIFGVLLFFCVMLVVTSWWKSAWIDFTYFRIMLFLSPDYWWLGGDLVELLSSICFMISTLLVLGVSCLWSWCVFTIVGKGSQKT